MHPRTVLGWCLILALVVGLTPGVDAAAVDSARIDAFLTSAIADAMPGDELVVFVHATDADVARSAVRASGLRLVDVFEKVDVAVAVGAPDRILAAGREPGVTFLEGNHPIEFYLDTAREATRSDLAVQGFEGSEGVDGSGVSIAVVDTGVDGTHPMFRREDGTSKVIRNLKLACALLAACTGPDGDANDDVFIDVTGAGNDSDTISIGGHGTHVASIAGGVASTTADGRALGGTAPGAELVGISVGAALVVYGPSAGLNWVLEHHTDPCGDGSCSPIKVVNNSWGGTGEYDPDSVIDKLVNQLVQDDVTVVFAAGNSGGDGSTNNMNPHAQNPTPGVISVANYDDGDTGTRSADIAPSSSRGESGRPPTYPDVSAPGSSITAACRPYLAICASGEPDLDYGTISGTSMAAPHVAGIVALLLEADETLRPSEIEDVLEDTAHQFSNAVGYEPDLPDRNHDHTTSFDKGHGLVDAAAAVADILSVEAPAVEACAATDGSQPVVVDAAGDATRVIAPTPLASEDSLDIRRGTLDWDAEAESLTFTITVEDLKEDNPPGTTGVFFEFAFNHGGSEYYVAAERSDVDGERFVLGRLATTREALAELTGGFDLEADTITVVLTNDDIANLNADETLDVTVAPFVDGDVLTGFGIDSRRQFDLVAVAFIPDADSAGGVCAFTIVGGSTTVAPSPPPPTPDLNLSIGGMVAWENGPFTNIYEFFGCPGLLGDSCDTTTIDVAPPSDGVDARLFFHIRTERELTDDFDLIVLGPDGTQVGSSGNPGTRGEWVILNLNPAEHGYGVYTVVVEAWLTVEATYEGMAWLQKRAN